MIPRRWKPQWALTVAGKTQLLRPGWAIEAIDKGPAVILPALDVRLGPTFDSPNSCSATSSATIVARPLDPSTQYDPMRFLPYITSQPAGQLPASFCA